MLSDLNRIKTFMEIVRVKSFSKASKNLGLSQPAVTLQMKKLEGALQTTLIYRKKNGIVLTNDGEKFYRLCKRFEVNILKFEKDASHIKDEVAPIHISTTEFIGRTFMPLLLEDIKEATKSQISLNFSEYDELPSCILKRRCDFAITNDKICNEKIFFKKICNYEMVLVSNKKVENNLEIDDLNEIVFIKDKTKCHLKKCFEIFGLRYDDFKVAYSIYGANSVKVALLNNEKEQYFSFLPKKLVKNEIEEGKLYKVEVNGLKIVNDLYIAGLMENRDLINKVAANISID